MKDEITQFEAQILSSLAGIQELSLEDLEPGALLAVLAVVGDALRLELPFSGYVSRPIVALSRNAFRNAFCAFLVEIETWGLPRYLTPDEKSHTYDWAVWQRDSAESIFVATRRFLLPQGILPDLWEEVQRVNAALMDLDFTCGGQLKRADAERALGVRVELRGSWLDRLPV